MLDLRLEDMELAELMKEQIDIVRGGVKGYIADDSSSYTVLASDVSAVVMPTQTPQTITPEGQVIDNPDFECMLYDPLSTVKNGDLIIRAEGPRLKVVSVFHPKNTYIMILGADAQQR